MVEWSVTTTGLPDAASIALPLVAQGDYALVEQITLQIGEETLVDTCVEIYGGPDDIHREYLPPGPARTHEIYIHGGVKIAPGVAATVTLSNVVAAISVSGSLT